MVAHTPALRKLEQEGGVTGHLSLAARLRRHPKGKESDKKLVTTETGLKLVAKVRIQIMSRI